MSSPRYATPRAAAAAACACDTIPSPLSPHMTILHTSPATSTGLYAGPSMHSSSARYEGKEKFVSVKGAAKTFYKGVHWHLLVVVACRYVLHCPRKPHTGCRRTEC